jgi:translation initiation factor 3 subunit L
LFPREITEKYFATTGWPDASLVSSECGGDDDFLLLYREMALRARSMVSGSFKFQAVDFIESWKNYESLFNFISRVADSELVLTSQWIYDIVQEFVYQFQVFIIFDCMHRFC